MQLNIETTKEDVIDYFEQLDSETKNEILNSFTADQVIGSVTMHLKGDGHISIWDTSGWRWGSELRNAIAEIKGTDKELLKDHNSKIKSLKHDIEHYKKFYDYYFKLYHIEPNELYIKVKEEIGEPT